MLYYITRCNESFFLSLLYQCTELEFPFWKHLFKKIHLLPLIQLTCFKWKHHTEISFTSSCKLKRKDSRPCIVPLEIKGQTLRKNQGTQTLTSYGYMNQFNSVCKCFLDICHEEVKCHSQKSWWNLKVLISFISVHIDKVCFPLQCRYQKYTWLDSSHPFLNLHFLSSQNHAFPKSPHTPGKIYREEHSQSNSEALRAGGVSLTTGVKQTGRNTHKTTAML